MFPVLLRLEGFEIHTYGVLLALGFVFGVHLATRQAEQLGLDPGTVTNILLAVLVASIIGARAVFVLVNWQHFALAPGEIFQLHRGGLVYYGGLIGGALTGVLGAWRAGIPVGIFADIVPAGLCLGQILGRLGCLMNGCCYGAPATVPWALRLAHGPGAHVARHPTQIYEALVCSAIMALALAAFRRPHRAGMLMVGYLYLYGAGRFLVETFRGDFRGGTYLAGLSVSQSISLATIGLAAVLHLARLKADAERTRARTIE
ncbi:MAG: prolipoprotein diacylglyceryl transferase [Candidatus Wallbacteria bacterium]|nr:prolipoprotein diacylglyceryl transferase [Candidatus Wallbacteria bacterium]